MTKEITVLTAAWRLAEEVVAKNASLIREIGLHQQECYILQSLVSAAFQEADSASSEERLEMILRLLQDALEDLGKREGWQELLLGFGERLAAKGKTDPRAILNCWPEGFWQIPGNREKMKDIAPVLYNDFLKKQN